MHRIVGLKYVGLLTVTAALLVLVGPLKHSSALLNFLPNRYIKISDAVQSHTNITYELGFKTSVVSALGSVEFEFCENDPLPTTSCTVPPGFDISTATIISQAGTNDFTIDNVLTNAHRIVFSRTASVVPLTAFKFELSGVKNPDNNGTQYARLLTYTGSSMGGSIVEQGGVAYNIHGDLSISTEVPPHIDLCVGITVSVDCTSIVGDSVDFGVLNVTTPRTTTSQFSSATNAPNGYSVSITGTTLTSGNNVIATMISLSNSYPGTNQFGLNLRQNISPSVGQEPTGAGTAVISASYNIPDSFTFNSGDNLVNALGSDNYRKFTASYIANIDRNQPLGVYAATMTFVALGNF